ncbi:SDR family NAD(P)-dependent oxidoreductase [Cupriavidus pauculus]|uniref:SDR family NAD(P)-dependent oxidoreductase n=1 Tax=Cupriavidus pauculus TaxID=82633 RepID=UPI001EE377C4|nr:glucose 1-dehydrogenase [Cupriavidus pauculus]GJG97252.1 glucose 1-dehydrogenase [Cupriavidus pauculus]
MRLQGKTALVTGGAGGIGRAIALRLAQEGADIVVAVHRHDAEADDTANGVRAAGRRAFVVAGDIGNVAQARDIVDQAVAAIAAVTPGGSLDILVNNAGVEVRAPFQDVTEADYDRVLDTNLKGPFFLTQQFVKHRLARKLGGKVINISSVHEDLPFPHFTSYCASKGGLRMMMRNLAIELAPAGITVNNIAPGAIQTPINRNLMADRAGLQALLTNIPLGRLGQPEEVAGLVAYLASTDADYITGATLVIDGGLLWNYAEQ